MIVRCPSFPTHSKRTNPDFDIPKHNLFETDGELVLAFFGGFLSPKIDNTGFGSHGHVRKSPHHENEEFSSSPIMKSKSY